MKKKWLVNLVLGFVKLTGVLPAFLFLKPRVVRAPGAPRRLPKPSLLVSNHRSLMDFVLYVLVFPLRSVRFLMAEVLFNKSKLFAWFLGAIGGIPVNRDTHDFSFVSNALEVLDNGGIVGVFPEARLPVNGKPFPFTVSTAFIAIHTDAPIIPVYTDGNYGIFKRARVVIGSPFYVSEHLSPDLPKEQQLQHLTDLLRQQVYGLQQYLEE